MQLTLLKSKIHRVHVTDANVGYEGSITIDEALMEAAGFVEYEKVLIGNITNGNRFETYVIRGKKGSGTICLNGATAHLGKVGDIITVFTFVQLKKKEIAGHRPTVVRVDSTNKITDKQRFIEASALRPIFSESNNPLLLNISDLWCPKRKFSFKVRSRSRPSWWRSGGIIPTFSLRKSWVE